MHDSGRLARDANHEYFSQANYERGTICVGIRDRCKTLDLCHGAFVNDPSLIW